MHSQFYSFFVFSFLTGCAMPGSYLPGQIYSIETGRDLDFQIEVSYGKGKVKATDKKTGEQFNGTYVAVRGGSVTIGTGFASAGGTNYSSVNSNGTFINGSVSGNQTTVTTTQNTLNALATATSFLIGDAGSALECAMNIQPGPVPKGVGECVDRQGVRYKLLF